MNIHLDDGRIMKVQRVRQRKIHLCIACHTKKIKCLKDRPICVRCKKLQLRCEFYLNDRVSRRPGKPRVEKPVQSDQFSSNTPLESSSSIASSTSPTSPKISISELVLENLPEKLLADHYLEVYGSTTDFSLPLLGLLDFTKLYVQFHSKPGSVDTLDFFAAYYVVLLSGSLLLGHDSRAVTYNHVLDEIFLHLNFPDSSENYTLRYLQLFTLHQSVLPSPLREAVLAAVRIAQLFGLNRDPVAYHSLTDPELVQFRRLLWWQIVRLELLSAVLENCSPFVDLETSDTSLPQTMDIFGRRNVRIEVANCKFRFVQLISKIIRNNYEDVQSGILDLHARCNGLILSLRKDLETANQKEKQLIPPAIENIKLLPDKAVFILYNLGSDRYIYPIQMPVPSLNPIQFTYTDYNRDSGYEYVISHLIKQLAVVLDGISSPRPLHHLMLSTCFGPHFMAHLIALLLASLLCDMSVFVENAKYSLIGDMTSDTLCNWLKEDPCFNAVNKFLAGKRYLDFCIEGFRHVCLLLNAIFLMIKCYPLKFGAGEYGTLNEYIDGKGLDDCNNQFVDFLEPYDEGYMGSLNLYSETPASAPQEQRKMDPGTISCSVIAPKSMTALAASGLGAVYHEIYEGVEEREPESGKVREIQDSDHNNELAEKFNLKLERRATYENLRFQIKQILAGERGSKAVHLEELEKEFVSLLERL